MKKYLIVVGLVLMLAVVPTAASAQTLSIAQLQAIVLQLQAQLNFLIAQLQAIQQRENPIIKPIESIRPSITVTSPNGGESYVSGQDTITARWNGYNLNADAHYKVYLYSPINSEVVSYNYPTQGGFLNKSYSFLIPRTVTTGEYKIGVCALNTERPDIPGKNVCDLSDNYFKITDSSTSQPSITVTSPNGGESWQKEVYQNITWKSNISDATVDIFLVWQGSGDCPNCGVSPNPAFIRKGAPNNGSYYWSVGLVVNSDNTRGYYVSGGLYGVMVCRPSVVPGKYGYYGRPGDCDEGDSFFKIYDSTTTNKPPVITGLTAPSTLSVGQTGTWVVKAYDPEGGSLNYNITWGDEYPAYATGIMMPKIADQTSTFTHSYSAAGTYKVAVTVSDTAGQSAQTTATVQVGSVPSLKSSLKVTVLDGGVQCFRAPCEFPLAGAQVALYNANKVLVGSQTVGSDGAANFSNLNPGTYTAYASASGYARSNAYTVGLVSGQAGSVKIPVYPATAANLTTDSQLAAVLQSLKGVLSGLSGSIGN